MRIIILGTGHVSTLFCRLFHEKGIQVIHVAGRTAESAKTLASLSQASYSDFHNIPSYEADMAILAVSDGFLLDELYTLPTFDIPVVHTAGAVPLQVLKLLSTSYGVLYPLQSIRKELTYIPDIPWLVDANQDSLRQTLQHLALLLSNRVRIADDAARLKLHLAAVWVSNFTNHLYALTEQYCIEQQIPFELLYPLIKETATRVEQNHPVDVQTGPAFRGDIKTMEKHLELLKSYPTLRALYIKLSDSIQSLSPKNSPE